MAIDLINHTLVDGNDFPSIGASPLRAAMLAKGLGLKAIRRKKVKLTNPKFEAYIVGL